METNNLFEIDQHHLTNMAHRGTLRLRASEPGPNEMSLAARDRLLALGLIERATEIQFYQLTTKGAAVAASIN